MKKHFTPLNITRFLFILIAAASILSMVINTGGLEMFLRFFSISSNMLIAFCMIYLALFLKDFKEVNRKKLVIAMLFWVTVYLILGNGLPLAYFIYTLWFENVLGQVGMTPLIFIGSQIVQIILIPLIIYLMLKFEVQSVFREKHSMWHTVAHILIIWGTTAGVAYLVYAAMA